MIRTLFGWFLHLGALGLVLLGVLDSSFLFFPLGNDLLLAVLVARNHGQLPIYVLAASVGSMIGVALLDLVSRRMGEEGLTRVLPRERLQFLMKKVRQKAWIALFTASLAPPPFPFTAVIAASSALQYPRIRLLGIVFLGRTLRFLLVGLAALRFGRGILRIANSTGFVWFMVGFTTFCLIGSAISVTRWIRRPQPTRVKAKRRS
ncbi:MAG: rane protein [Bryobacterales bacterium]|nr:rane protein [Bryobacterales bacterium]